ncbi:beta-ketoacyl synthase N-terminal-like domain-containing protein [Streptomyces sp. NPDC001520]|uniref:beta-ketoacyl synthase N-terminal-like domain-containing protein n=1 Tax=Streptomyces sp. NPDC001520 TaxID=3364581 RepID=UPI0036C5E919
MSSTQKFAIVGINCRLPGARDAGKYWSNLKAGTESITTWSLEELIDAGIDPEMAKNPGHVKSGQRALMERHQCLRHCRGTAEGADRWQHPSVATVPSVCADRCRSGRRHGEPGEDLRRGIRGLGGFHGCAGCSLGKRMRRNLCPLGSFLLADMSRLSS